MKRRNFIFTVGTSLLTLPLLASKLFAQDKIEPVAPDNATAKALGYVENTTLVDATKYPNHKNEQQCSGCLLFQGGALKVIGKDGVWGKCTLFPTNVVNEVGWCASWAKKA